MFEEFTDKELEELEKLILEKLNYTKYLEKEELRKAESRIKYKEIGDKVDVLASLYSKLLMLR